MLLRSTNLPAAMAGPSWNTVKMIHESEYDFVITGTKQNHPVEMAEQFTPMVQIKESSPVSALAPEQAVSLVPEAQSTKLVGASEQISRAAPSTVVPKQLAMLGTVSVVDTTGSEDETNRPVSGSDETGDSDDRLKIGNYIKVGGCNAVGTNSKIGRAHV